VGQVYRFKVALKYRRGLWRSIEVKGSQTMRDLDKMIREAFNHEWDHLSEFYLGKIWRSRGLGEINPFGGGSGAKKRVDSLKLSKGDTLEYVYDFGADIQHILTLEGVYGAEEGVEYPRIVSQNKPRYRYCESCKKEGKKVVATWICVECSEEAQRSVLLCEDCLMREHEDHYAEEKLY